MTTEKKDDVKDTAKTDPKASPEAPTGENKAEKVKEPTKDKPKEGAKKGPIANMKLAKAKAEESKKKPKPWFSYKESEKDMNRLLTRARNIPKTEKARGRYLKALTHAKQMLAHCKLKNLG